uniref:C2H2-type domain-containing protein n=1 Tax=Anopheles minimus TaxID=112268 RepID=A0A2C9H6H5_9DIPT
MGNDSKKRKKHHPRNGEGSAKKVRFSLPNDTEKLVVDDAAAPAPAPAAPAPAPAAGAAAAATATTSENDTELSSLSKYIRAWLQRQSRYEKASLEALLEESHHADEDHEQEIDIAALEQPIRKTLCQYSEEEKRKSFKYECEWSKCKFMSGTDRKYFLHVESHAEITLDKQSRSYVCEWDLCDFLTVDRNEFMGHVHYHAYHTKLKVHGASMHMLLKMPSCNNDSRARNTIDKRPVTFRCEWGGCTERFNKAMHFFHHASNHLIDQFGPDKKSSRVPLPCRWSLCKNTYQEMHEASHHIKAHTTEREIACYNCGTDFWSRVKFVDHCVRQVEMSLRKYKCTICDRYYPTMKLMKIHRVVHRTRLQCQLCPLMCHGKSHLAKHMLYKHLEQRNFKCGQCEYAGCTKQDLDAHLRAHDTTKIFRCEEFGCNVAYKSEQSLKRHISWHYNLPTPLYECHLCNGKRYTTSYKLSKHFQCVHQLQHPPGYGRYRYKADKDGIFRLAAYVQEKWAKQSQSEKVDEASSCTIAVSSDGDDDGESATGKQTDRPQSNSTIQPVTTHGAAAYAPLKGKPSIQSFKAVGWDEFALELKIDPEPTVEEQQSAQGSQAAATASKPKDVKDFTVMKRYLEPLKKVMKTEN